MVVYQIMDLTWDGRGVARGPDGRVVMIAGALPGDQVTATLSKGGEKGPRFGKVVELVVPSPLRVPHPCPHYLEGCHASPLGALRREAALEWKREHLAQTLARVGGIRGVEVRQPVASPRQWRYRDRLELHLIRLGSRFRLVYYAGDGAVPVRDCLLGGEPLCKALQRLGEALPEVKLPLRGGGRGEAARLLLRDNGRGEAVAVLFLFGKSVPPLEPFRRWLDRGRLAGWELRRSPGVKARLFASQVVHAEGDPLVTHDLAGGVLRAEPTVFSQANRHAGEV
ncbi:MAG TPA: hypothetical protein ENI92_07860, partial [Bacteroidetes bacterium]|nr:hypothetical protein [Bacteroidota bacterium]